MSQEQAVRRIEHTKNGNKDETWVEKRPARQVNGAHVARHIVNIIATTLLVILGLRFIFDLFGASRASEFSRAIYNLSQPLVEPFIGILPTVPLGNGRSELNAAILMGILAVAFISYALQQMLHTFEKEPSEEPV